MGCHLCGIGIFFFLKREMKDEQFNHVGKTFRENVQNQLEESS